MGRIADLQIQIQEMAMEGFTIDHIATTLDVPKSWVNEAIEALNDENDYESHPDEAQEWHDFDPDC